MGYTQLLSKIVISYISKNDKFHCSNAVAFCYNHFRTCPSAILSWDPKTRSFYRSKHYHLWLFGLVVIFAGTAGGGTTLNLLLHTHFKLSQTIFSAVILVCVFMNFGFGLVLYFYCDDIILAFAAMQGLQQKSEGSSMKWKSNREHEKLEKEWKAISIILHISILCMIPMKWLLPGILLYHNLDPCYALHHVFKPWLPVYADAGLRFASILITANVALQIYSITMTCLFFWLEMQAKYLTRLSSVVEENDEQFFNWYSAFDIASGIWKDAVSEIIRVCMGCMHAVIVVCLVVSIRYFDQMPLSTCWFVPTVALVNAMMFCIMLPYLTGCLEQTKQLIADKKRMTSMCLKPKWSKVKLRSLRYVAMHCGGTFPLKRHTKSEFFRSVVDRTLDGVLI